MQLNLGALDIRAVSILGRPAHFRVYYFHITFKIEDSIVEFNQGHETINTLEFSTFEVYTT